MDLKKIFSSTVSCEASGHVESEVQDGNGNARAGAVSAASSSLDAVYNSNPKSKEKEGTSSVYRYRYSNRNNHKGKKKRPRATSTKADTHSTHTAHKDQHATSYSGVNHVSENHLGSGFGYYNNNVVIMGAGRLGQSLAGFRSASTNGIKVVGVFDNDPMKIGLAIGVGGENFGSNCQHLDTSYNVIVESEEHLPHRVHQHFVKRGIIAVPPLNAQEAADALVNAGVQIILNYAPINIYVPDDVHCERIDPAVQFSRLALDSRSLLLNSQTKRSSFLRSLFNHLEETGEAAAAYTGFQKANCGNITISESEKPLFNATRALRLLFWQFPLTLEYTPVSGESSDELSCTQLFTVSDTDGSSVALKRTILVEQLPLFRMNSDDDSDLEDDEADEYDSFFNFLISEKERELEDISSTSTAVTSTTTCSTHRSSIGGGSVGSRGSPSLSSPTDLDSNVVTEQECNETQKIEEEISNHKIKELNLVSSTKNEKNENFEFKKLESTNDETRDFRPRPNSVGPVFKEQTLKRCSLSSPSLLSQVPDSAFSNSIKKNTFGRGRSLKYVNRTEENIDNSNVSSLNPEQYSKKSTSSVIIPDKADKWFVKERPDITFKDVAGLLEAKSSLKEFLSVAPGPVSPSKAMNDICSKNPWRSLLLYGPPGCGKSMLARAAIGEMFDSFSFFSVSATDLIVSHNNPGKGVSVHRLFEYATQKKSIHSRVVIFLDNVDQLCKHRHLKAELLQQLDALRNNDILLMAATNLPWDIDIALFRHFEKRVVVPLPDASARCEIFKQSGALDNIANTDDLNRLAQATKHYSASDVSLVVKDALMQPARRQLDSSHLSIDDFMQSARQVRPTISREIIRLYNSFGTKFGHKCSISGEELDDIRHLSLYS